MWLGLVLAAGVGGLLTIALLPSVNPPPEPVGRPDTGPSTTVAQPAPLTLTPALKTELFHIARAFVASSVGRNHPERSFALVHPALRQGLTREQWKEGNIPVVPFPVADQANWAIDEASEREVLMEVLLLPKPGSGLLAKTFLLSLRPAGNPPRWLVSSWVPFGLSAAQMSADARQRGASAEPRHRSSLSSAWLLIPLALLGITVVAPVLVFALDAYKGRRAERRHREYQRARSGSSSSPS